MTKNIRNTVFEIFFKYTETCITENVDFENVFLQSRFLYRQTKRKNLLREWKQLKQKEQLEDNNNNNNNNNNSSSNNNNNNNNNNNANNQSNRMNISGDDDDINSASGSDESSDAMSEDESFDDYGRPISTTNSNSRSSDIDMKIPKPELMITLSILYIACLKCKETITIQDLETWADNGTIPYWFVYDNFMPTSMQYQLKHAKVFFRGTGRSYRRGKSRWQHMGKDAIEGNKYWFENRRITLLASRICFSLETTLPKINVKALSLRLCFSMGIPSIIAKISAMAADMLSNIDHWCMIKREDDNSRSGSNNKFTQKKLF